MDYEQFYRYLDSRPPAEIAECLRGVTKVARKHSVMINGESEGENASQNHRRQIAEQVWSQQAMWNKFGSGSSEPVSLLSLQVATSSLTFRSDVGSFVVRVNKMIDAEVARSRKSLAKEGNFFSANEARSTNAVHSAPLIASRKVPNRTSPVVTESATSSDSEWMESSDSEMDVESASDRSVSRTGSPPTSRNRSTNTATGAKFVWTAAVDKALEASVTKYKKDGWAAVAEHICYGVSPDQCRKRWYDQLKPLMQGLKGGGDWTDAEVTRLVDLVPKYTVAPYWSDQYRRITKPHVSWKLIGEELGKIPRECYRKWVSGNK